MAKKTLNDFILFPEDFAKNAKFCPESIEKYNGLARLSVDENDIRLSQDWAYLADRAVGS